MFESIINLFKKFSKKEEVVSSSKDTAKERLHLVLMQDRANISVDFLDMMKQEIIDVIKKYIEVDEKEIDVKLTNKTNEDGSIGAPALYANIPISKIKNENKEKINKQDKKNDKIDNEIKNEKNKDEENKDEENKDDENNKKSDNTNLKSEIKNNDDTEEKNKI